MYYYLKGDTMTKLCARGKAAAKRKFKVYPSAYANAYASKICAGKIKDPSGVKRKDFKGPKKAKDGDFMKKPESRLLIKKRDKLRPYVSVLKDQRQAKNENSKTTEKTKKVRLGIKKSNLDLSVGYKKNKITDNFYNQKTTDKDLSVRYNTGKGNFGATVTKTKKSNPFSGSMSGKGVTIQGTVYLDKIFGNKTGGVMKVKKAGLGAAMIFKDDIRGKGALLPAFGLAGMAKYQSMNKKDNMPEDKKASGITKKETQGMALGGMTPQGTGSYLKQDIDGDESFTNASALAYYKGMV